MHVTRAASAIVRRLVLPLTPLHRRLALIAWTNRRFEGGEPELAALDRIVPPNCRTAVDAGANVGLYAIRLAGLCRTVHAFEINAGITAHLQHARLPNATLWHTGLSSADREVTLHVPVLPTGLVLDGWASLAPGNCPDARDHVQIAGHVRTLDSFDLRDVDFMKIDVEGHELDLLAGAVATLDRDRPRILIEAKSLAPVADFLGRFAYRARRADHFGVHGSPPWMHVFEPVR
jgi:FkbM family methyltransferase